MKKLLILITCFILAFSSVACVSGGGSSSSPQGGNEGTAEDIFD